MHDDRFDLASARRHADAGQIEAWVDAYLTGGYWANPGLSEGLKLAPRWWNGPLELLLTELVRCCGPEPEMEFIWDAGDWAAYTRQMADGLTELSAVPPLIAEHRHGLLSVRDGNSRHEAMRLRGWPSAWALIWYNSEADYLRHTAQLVSEGRLPAGPV
jgi:hypothetical protein